MNSQLTSTLKLCTCCLQELATKPLTDSVHDESLSDRVETSDLDVTDNSVFDSNIATVILHTHDEYKDDPISHKMRDDSHSPPQPADDDGN